MPVPEEKKKIIGLLFLEGISLAGISRVTGVSTRAIQTYPDEKYGNILREISVTVKKVGRLTIDYIFSTTEKSRGERYQISSPLRWREI